jgi:hypothetical protein
LFAVSETVGTVEDLIISGWSERNRKLGGAADAPQHRRKF